MLKAIQSSLLVWLDGSVKRFVSSIAKVLTRLAHRMLRIFFWLSIAQLASTESWSYDRCSAHGPESWDAAYCAGVQNSPIDICDAEPKKLPSLRGTDWCTTRTMKIKNNGHTIQAGIQGDYPTLVAGNLAEIVGRADSDTPYLWALEQLHFHWGRSNFTDEGSEHWLNGKGYPLEVHFVHYNRHLGDSVGDVVKRWKSHALLVVGVFFDLEADGEEPAALTKIGNAVMNASAYLDSYTEMNETVALSDIFDTSGNYSAYPGGLTTPTCNEIVTWVVMETPKKITRATLDKFKAAPIPTAKRGGVGLVLECRDAF